MGAGNDTVTTGRGVDYVSMGAGTDTLVMNWSGSTTNITFKENNPWPQWHFADGGGNKLTIADYRDTENFNLTSGSGDDYLTGRTDAA